MDVYTRKGDDGTTGMFHGGRVAKDHLAPEAYGAVDEAVAALGVARAEADGELADRLLETQRDLFVVAAELATNPARIDQLVDGVSRTTSQMVVKLEGWIDDLVAVHGQPDRFIVPGAARLPAALDQARAVVRRAERRAVSYVNSENVNDSQVIPYLNRLADYIYMLVRSTEPEWQPSRVED